MKNKKNNIVRFNKGKLRVDLVPPEVTEIFAEVSQVSLKKYKERSWEKGQKLHSHLFASARRHLLKWEKGEDIDPESGLPHIYHAMWNVNAMAVFYKRDRGDLDDRPEEKNS